MLGVAHCFRAVSDQVDILKRGHSGCERSAREVAARRLENPRLRCDGAAALTLSVMLSETSATCSRSCPRDQPPRDTFMQMTGGQALARQLVLEGLTDVFGIPGVQLDWAVDGCAMRQPASATSCRATNRPPPTWPTAMPAPPAGRRLHGRPGPGLLNAWRGWRPPMPAPRACWRSPATSIAGDRQGRRPAS